MSRADDQWMFDLNPPQGASMKTIDITLASPEIAELVERACLSADYGFTDEELDKLGPVADAIREARERVQFRVAGDRFFGKVAP